MGAGAEDVTVTIVDGTKDSYDYYGTRSTATTPNTLTTKVTSGVAGLVFSAPVIDRATYWNTRCLLLKPSNVQTDESITITAPDGYDITGYTITVRAMNNTNTYKMTVGDDTKETIDNNADYTFSKTGLSTSTINMSFQQKSTTNNWLAVKAMTVQLVCRYVTYGVDKGTFYNSSGTSITSGWAQWWTSGLPAITFKSSAGHNINPTNGYFFPGNNNSGIGNGDYYITCNNPSYRITGYTLTATGQSNVTTDQTITPIAGGDATSWSANKEKTLIVSGLKSAGTSFNMAGSHVGLAVSSFKFYVEETNPITNLSDLSNSKSYYVTGLRGTLQYSATDATAMTSSTNSADVTAMKHRIAFLKSANNNLYAYSVNTGKFLATGNTLSDTPAPIYISETGNANYPWFLSLSSDKSSDNILINGSGEVQFSTYNTLDDGDRWAIVEAADFDATDALSAITEYESETVYVTYNMIFNEEIIGTREVVHNAGDAAASPWTTPAFSSLSLDVSEITAETKTVNVTLTWSGPFNFSSSYNDASWYYWKLHDKWVIYGETAPYSLLSEEASAKATAEKALWAFVGDPFNGVKIINKAAGEGNYLYPYANNPSMSSTEHSWVIGNNSNRTDGVAFSYDGSSFWINDNAGSGKLAYWDNSSAANDYGSLCELDPVVYYDLALAYIEKYSTDNAIGDDEYFGVRTADKNAYKTSIITEYSANQSALTSSVYENTIKSGCTNLIKYPETGYYRIKTPGRDNRYMGLESDVPKSYTTNTGANTIVKLIKDGDDYKFLLQGMYLNAPVRNNNMSIGDAGASFTAEVYDIGQAGFKSSECYIHAGNAGKNWCLIGWDNPSSSEASRWIVEDATSVTVSLNSGGDGNTYATLYLPFGATIDGESDVNAYILGISGEYAVANNIGQNIPANTGVMLKGTATSVNLAINDAATATTTGNVLTGTCVQATATNTSEYKDLVLGMGATSGTLGFYLAPSGTLAANKAYIHYKVPAGGEARVAGFPLLWDDELTGIGDAKHLNDQSEMINGKQMFDLQGRRVENPQRGLYIVGGRKIVIK